MLIKLQKGEYSMNRLKSASLIFVSLAFMTSVVVNTPAIQTNATTVTLNENERVVNIELGGFFTIAMTNQNRIFAWGRNDRGQLGVASPSSSNVPIDITSRFPFISEETIVDIKLGFEHALALTSTGRVFSWGSSNAYENSFSFNVNIPTIITGITFNAGEVVTKIAAGGNSSIILTSGNRLFAFGNGEAGQLVGSSSFNAPKNISSSFSLDVGETFVDIELGSAHSSFITSNNRVFMMGDNRNGQIGNDYQGGNYSRSPVNITSNIPVSPNGVTKAYLGHEHSVLFAPLTGNAFVFGSNSYAALGTNAFAQSVPANMAQNVASGEHIITAIDAGFRHGAALRTDQQFFIWGTNGWGEVSLPTANANQKLPINITEKFNLFDDETILDFSLGGGQSSQGAVQGAHTGIVTSLGRIFMFGSNSFGQLGIGTTAANVSALNATINTVSFISVSFDPTITFDVNGGSVVTAIKLPEGTAINAPSNPTKLGYTFDGWFTDIALTNAFTFSTMPGEDTTLFAKWAIQTYTISYELNGGINAVSNPGSFNITTPTITLDNPTKVGHTFFAWYNNSSFTGSAITTISLGTTGNQTLHAKYDVNQYTITFDTNEGSLVSPITQNFDSVVSQPTAPAKALYTFAGWFSDEALTATYIFTKMPAADITLYAKWTLNQYTITFDSKGGSSVSGLTQDYDSSVSAPSNPTKSGYTFAGWFSDEGLLSTYTFNKMPGENITLYAKWTLNTYTINFTLNGGTLGANQITSYTIVDQPVSLVPATLAGHVFKGFYRESSFQTLISSVNTSEAANLTVYALFFTTAFDTFYNQVSQLPNPITIEDKSLITSYLATYETLSNFEKGFIDLTLIQTALNTISTLEINAVVNAIDDFSNPITLLDEDDVLAARSAYDALSAEQKQVVANYQDLVAAEDRLAILNQQLIDETIADDIIETITTLPEVESISLTDEEAILQARQAYDALTEEQKALVTNYDELVAAEARITILKQQVINETAAQGVINLIDELPPINELTLDDAAQLTTVRVAFDALTSNQQSLVTNYQMLLDVEAQLLVLQTTPTGITTLQWVLILIMIVSLFSMLSWLIFFKKKTEEKKIQPIEVSPSLTTQPVEVIPTIAKIDLGEVVFNRDIKTAKQFIAFSKVTPGSYLEITPDFASTNRVVEVSDTLPKVLNEVNRFIALSPEEVKAVKLSLTSGANFIKKTPGSYIDQEGYYVEVDLENQIIDNYIFARTRLAPTTTKGHRWIRIETRKIQTK
jgi:uncharacterized repeat protein (TIGR02543 family)